MTTKVVVSASGPMYPARVLHVRRPGKGEREILCDKLVASGETLEAWCGSNDTITVTEEYHPNGYPPPTA